MSSVAARKARPKYLSLPALLFEIRLPLPGWVSILHRVSGALLDAKGVACVPGSAFGEPRALRISYTCPTAQLPEGLKRFREFFAELT